MKKLLALVAIAGSLSFFSCKNGGDDAKTTGGDSTKTAAPAPAPTPAPAPMVDSAKIKDSMAKAAAPAPAPAKMDDKKMDKKKGK